MAEMKIDTIWINEKMGKATIKNPVVKKDKQEFYNTKNPILKKITEIEVEFRITASNRVYIEVVKGKRGSEETGKADLYKSLSGTKKPTLSQSKIKNTRQGERYMTFFFNQDYEPISIYF